MRAKTILGDNLYECFMFVLIIMTMISIIAFFLLSHIEKREEIGEVRHAMLRTRNQAVYLRALLEHRDTNRFPSSVDVCYNGHAYYSLPATLLPENMLNTTIKYSTWYVPHFNDYYLFRDFKTPHQLQYIDGKEWYIVASCGPDRDYEQSFYDNVYKGKHEYSIEQIIDLHLPFVYDPSNGSISSGDIIVIGESFALRAIP